jgi:hypothetical protein
MAYENPYSPHVPRPSVDTDVLSQLPESAKYYPGGKAFSSGASDNALYGTVALGMSPLLLPFLVMAGKKGLRRFRKTSSAPPTRRASTVAAALGLISRCPSSK